MKYQSVYVVLIEAQGINVSLMKAFTEMSNPENAVLGDNLRALKSCVLYSLLLIRKPKFYLTKFNIIIQLTDMILFAY